MYGAFGDLDQHIDGVAGGLPRGARDPDFRGLHRIELGLWRGAAARALRAGRAAARARRRAPAARDPPGPQITPLDYATRAHEILEDAQRDYLSGVDVPWSREGVLATSSALDRDAAS